MRPVDRATVREEEEEDKGVGGSVLLEAFVCIRKRGLRLAQGGSDVKHYVVDATITIAPYSGPLFFFYKMGFSYMLSGF